MALRAEGKTEGATELKTKKRRMAVHKVSHYSGLSVILNFRFLLPITRRGSTMLFRKHIFLALFIALLASGCERSNREVKITPKCDPQKEKNCPKPSSSGALPSGGDEGGEGEDVDSQDLEPVEDGEVTTTTQPSTVPPTKPDASPPPKPSSSDKPDSSPDTTPDLSPDPSSDTPPDPVPPPDLKPDSEPTGKDDEEVPLDDVGPIKELGLKGGIKSDGSLSVKFSEKNHSKVSEIKLESSGSVKESVGPSPASSTVVIGTILRKAKLKFKFESLVCVATAVSGVDPTPDLSVETRCK